MRFRQNSLAKLTEIFFTIFWEAATRFYLNAIPLLGSTFFLLITNTIYMYKLFEGIHLKQCQRKYMSFFKLCLALLRELQNGLWKTYFIGFLVC